MASIRRTQPPAYADRSIPGGGIQRPVSSQTHKFLSSSKYSSPLSSFPAFAVGARKFVVGALFQKYHPRKVHGWRRAFYRCTLCFMVGLFLGLLPFGRVNDDIRSNDFLFETKPSRGEVNWSSDSRPRKQLIVVTPTYNRAFQAYFLNRLSQALRLVHPPLLWVVVEMHQASMETADILRKTGVMYRHLVCTKNMTNLKDRGVHQRNTALDYIEHHKLDGILYFADDDNIYSLELFESLRTISRLGTWSVAMLAQNKNKAILEGAVCNGSHVLGWHTNEKSKRLRRFHVDMSGFAFNTTILWDSKRWQRLNSSPIRQLDTVKEGFQETTFMTQLVEDETQMEGTSPGCSRVMNWHLHLESPNLIYPKEWLLQKNLDFILPIK